MAGIVTALEAHDDIGLLRQPVDDLALPLVTPLGADDDNIGHFESPILKLQRFRARLPGKEVPVSPEACLARPMPQAFWAGRRASHRITEAGASGKQEQGFWGLPKGHQAIDIP